MLSTATLSPSGQYSLFTGKVLGMWVKKVMEHTCDSVYTQGSNILLDSGTNVNGTFINQEDWGPIEDRNENRENKIVQGTLRNWLDFCAP